MLLRIFLCFHKISHCDIDIHHVNLQGTQYSLCLFWQHIEIEILAVAHKHILQPSLTIFLRVDIELSESFYTKQSGLFFKSAGIKSILKEISTPSLQQLPLPKQIYNLSFLSTTLRFMALRYFSFSHWYGI